MTAGASATIVVLTFVASLATSGVVALVAVALVAARAAGAAATTGVTVTLAESELLNWFLIFKVLMKEI